MMRLLQLLQGELRTQWQVIIYGLLAVLVSFTVSVLLLESATLIGWIFVAISLGQTLMYLTSEYYFMRKKERLLMVLPVPRSRVFWIPVMFVFLTVSLLFIMHLALMLIFNIWFVDASTVVSLQELTAYALISLAVSYYYSFQFTLENLLGERLSCLANTVVSAIPAVILIATFAMIMADAPILAGTQDAIRESFRSGTIIPWLTLIIGLLVAIDYLLFLQRSQFDNPGKTNSMLRMIQGERDLTEISR